MDPALARSVSAALTRLCTRSPFFGTLAMFARIEASGAVPTAATDGRDIFINPAFYLPLTPPEQDAVLLHEVLHAALLHVPRRESREPLLWNIAADIVVNGMLAANHFTLPSGALRDQHVENLRVEEIYELILVAALSYGLEWPDLLDGPPGDCGAAEGTGALGEARRSALERYWRHALEQAQVVSQSTLAGNAPGRLSREFEQAGTSQLDWRSYLWRYLTATPTDFSEFDRRFVGRGLYLETLAGESVRVRIAVDISGSVGDAQLQALLAEVRGILNAYPHLDCELYYVDVELDGPHSLRASAPLPAPIGAGGTDFRPFFERIKDESAGWQPVLAVYLTDGFGEFPDQPPACPVLWVVTPGGLPNEYFPFGEVIRLLVAG